MSKYTDTAPGIYAIYVDGVIRYVGQSGNVKNRWRQHKGALKRVEHENDALQAAFTKRGAKSFCFVSLHLIPDVVVSAIDAATLRALLLSLEQSFIGTIADMQPNHKLFNEL
jgi:hypothetical protein